VTGSRERSTQPEASHRRAHATKADKKLRIESLPHTRGTCIGKRQHVRPSTSQSESGTYLQNVRDALLLAVDAVCSGVGCGQRSPSQIRLAHRACGAVAQVRTKVAGTSSPRDNGQLERPGEAFPRARRGRSWLSFSGRGLTRGLTKSQKRARPYEANPLWDSKSGLPDLLLIQQGTPSRGPLRECPYREGQAKRMSVQERDGRSVSVHGPPTASGRVRYGWGSRRASGLGGAPSCRAACEHCASVAPRTVGRRPEPEGATPPQPGTPVRVPLRAPKGGSGSPHCMTATEAKFPSRPRGREVGGVELVLPALASGGLLVSFSESRKVFLDGQSMA